MAKAKAKAKAKATIQSKGGKARAAAMTPEERSEVARAAAESRWAAKEAEGKNRLPRATHAGTLVIGTIQLPCAVLADGRRVLTQPGLLQAIGRGRLGSSTVVESEGRDGMHTDVPSFVAAENLKPFISEDMRRTLRPIRYRSKAGGFGGVAVGYDATALPLICRVFLEARDRDVLTTGPRGQLRIAQACDVLIRGLATVGIVALVDEATGYQRDRDRDELHKILALFIAKELLPWARRFPDEFYKEMFRLKGWRAFDHNAAQGPRFAGKLTNQLVYERLPAGVLDELRRKNPAENNRRKHAHHQFLTREIGNPHLERHIASVTTLMRAARTWTEFEDMANRGLPPRALPAPETDPQLRTAALDDGAKE